MRIEDETEDRFDRLWEATRPAAPSAEAWDRVWATVSDRLDDEAPAASSDVLPLVTPAARRMRFGAVALVLVAQAAAVLLAVGLALRGGGPKPSLDDVSRTATAVVRIEEGQLVLIRSDADADSVRTIDLSTQAGPAGVDAWYVVYNLLESTAGPVVAMSR